MKITEKQIQKIKNELANYTNEDLLEETLFLAGGDDYDGGFTKYGEMRFNLMKEELNKRLKKWLSDSNPSQVNSTKKI